MKRPCSRFLGYMFPVEAEGSSDGLFLPLISCWGWATWQRAWTQFDTSVAGYDRLKRDPQLRARFNLDNCYDYFGMLRDQIEGRIDSGVYAGCSRFFSSGGLILYPQHSLVQNVGIDGSGHARGGYAAFAGRSSRQC